MKVGNRISGREVDLPSEVLELILLHVDQPIKKSERQGDLWSCSLTSRSWYSASIKRLYRSPSLTTKNFDLFARTLCPPVNSHVRAIGLEDFIVDLDMGGLAYESTKSLTARLLRRTRKSLEKFVAPSVSFSLVSLAPLSKAENLRHLDLSNDFYDIDMSQLLRATCDLIHLSFLSIPKGALRRADIPSKIKPPHRWPPNLVHLQLNGCLPSSIDGWNSLVADLPPGLHTLSIAFLSQTGRLTMDLFGYLTESAPQVTKLYIWHLRCEPSQILGLSTPFPCLESVTLPYDEGVLQGLSRSTIPLLSSNLKALRLVDDLYINPLVMNPVDWGAKPDDLGLLAGKFPSLKQIEVPERYGAVFRNEQDIVELEALQRIMGNRGPSGAQPEAGVFLGKAPEYEEPSWIKNTWGLRREEKK